MFELCALATRRAALLLISKSKVRVVVNVAGYRCSPLVSAVENKVPEVKVTEFRVLDLP